MTSRSPIFVGVLILVTLVTAACRARTEAYTAEVTSGMSNRGMSHMTGKLYLNGEHIRIDWGLFADVFDLKQRKGWRILSETKTYQELGSKDLSTFAPEMTGGSICPHAQVPSQCKLVGTEVIEGRPAKKWDVYNPNGFHVYFWTDEQLGITVRMAMGEATAYQVTSFRQHSVSDSMFQLPSGYEKAERPFKP